MQNSLDLDSGQLIVIAICFLGDSLMLMRQAKLIVITIATILIGMINVSQQQLNASNYNETAADEQNPDKEFDVPQLPIGQIVPGETNTTSFSIS
jgi:hypothetical protein